MTDTPDIAALVAEVRGWRMGGLVDRLADALERLARERDELKADRDYWYKRYEETVRKLPIRKDAEDRSWPNWGDSPNGFDGPGGAE